VSESANRPPILLCNADYYGTLAATRLLGRSGIPVTVASETRMAVSGWSRYAARSLKCPPSIDSERFVDWLLAFGQREPGHVLYPTSDDVTYLFSLHKEELSRYFRLCQPEIEGIINVLDKKKLYMAAHEAGICTPETRFPETDAEVELFGRELELPLLIKPRTQVLFRSHSKGILVRNRAELLPKYRQFVRSNDYGGELFAGCPEATHPMLQEYHARAADRIYSLACFLDPSSGLFAARGSFKVLQRPRRLGIGLCFEDAPVDKAFAQGIRRLGELTGYEGLCQTESIYLDGRCLLIDFNPRFYNQLVFDIVRGLPLPLIVYAAALGERATVARLLKSAEECAGDQDRAFCNRLGFELMISMQRLSNRMSIDEARGWRQWFEGHRVVDSTVDKSDPLPALADVARHIHEYLLHPRSFVRSIVLDR
jgi:predicted ATP-grasp superfamily ATP-dependent carboligase